MPETRAGPEPCRSRTARTPRQTIGQTGGVVIFPAKGEVRVQVAFQNFGDRTVYHCHILDMRIAADGGGPDR